MPIKRIQASYRQSPATVRAALTPLVIIYLILRGKAALKTDLWLLSGHEKHSGHPLKLAFSGTPGNKGYWKRIVFDKSCKEQHLGRHWCWNVSKAITALDTQIDLVAEQRCRYLSALDRKPRCFYVPVFVAGHMVPHLIDLSTHAVRGDIRRIEKNELQYEIETDPAVLEDFCNTAFMAHLENRYDGEFTPLSFKQLTRGARWNEGLFITKDTRRVAGIILSGKKQEVAFKCPSMIPGNEALLKQGAMQALYYFSAQYLQEKGIKKISYGSTRPFFRDGLMIWKKKWGQQLTHCGALVQRVRIIQDRPAVRSFLMENPCVTIEGNDRAGIVFVNGQDPSGPSKYNKLIRYTWPGIKRVIVYCFDQIPEAAAELSKNHPIHFRSADELLALSQAKK